MPIDITGIDPALVLMALHEAATSSFHGAYKHSRLTLDDAQAMLEEEKQFGYVNGKAIFVKFEGNLVHVDEYDRRNNLNRLGLAARVLAPHLVIAADKPKEASTDRVFQEEMRKLGIPVVPQ